ncbi:MAG: Rieske 2Fe-2S domain-containing protein [Caldilineaceae bacterium]
MNKVTQQPAQSQLTRRSFFGLTWLVALLAAAGQLLVGLKAFFTPVLAVGAFGTEVKVGRVHEFEVGSISYFRKSRFYLVRLPEGFLAMYRKCPHLGCVVPWDEAAGNFNCPCHSSLFTTQGEVISGPAPRPLDLFPVVIRGDEVFVNTGRIIERTAFEQAQVTPVA